MNHKSKKFILSKSQIEEGKSIYKLVCSPDPETVELGYTLLRDFLEHFKIIEKREDVWMANYDVSLVGQCHFSPAFPPSPKTLLYALVYLPKSSKFIAHNFWLKPIVY